jgi:hypothetical protein
MHICMSLSSSTACAPFDLRLLFPASVAWPASQSVCAARVSSTVLVQLHLRHLHPDACTHMYVSTAKFFCLWHLELVTQSKSGSPLSGLRQLPRSTGNDFPSLQE